MIQALSNSAAAKIDFLAELIDIFATARPELAERIGVTNSLSI